MADEFHFLCCDKCHCDNDFWCICSGKGKKGHGRVST